ncbi:MAG: glycosyltransferase [archaeon]
MQRLHIAIFTDTFLPQINGVSLATVLLAQGLAKKKHKVIIVCPQYTKNDPSLPGVKLCRVPSLPAFFYEKYKAGLPLQPKLFKALHDVDVIHFQTPFTLGLSAVAIAHVLKKPLVQTFHTFYADPQYLQHAGLNKPWAERLMWKYASWINNQCQLITTPSAFTRRELIRKGCTQQIIVISNGVVKSTHNRQGAMALQKKYGKDLLLFVGRIAHEKNIDYLLDCFKMVSRRRPSAKLLLVGDGPQRDDAMRTIKRLRLSEKVILLGSIPHDELLASGTFEACKLFVTASVTENQPLTILEAQEKGLVCIGVRAKGIPDCINNGKTGYVLKRNDKKGFAKAIVRLLEDDRQYAHMKSATLTQIREHRIDAIIGRWEKAYAALL